MPCYSMMLAGQVPGRTLTGKPKFKFLGKASSYWCRTGHAPTKCLLLPCRQCIGCRLERSRMWATRLVQETKSHDKACFLTLTYADFSLPVDKSLNPTHLKTFFKDLRSRMDYLGKEKIKYFAVGEYGELTKRPHYHAILYGPIGCLDDDPLRSPEEPSRSGDSQYSHSDIAAVWPYGRHRLSEVTFESAAYVARYCLKKITGTSAEDHYGDRTPEFQRSSKGLGKDHFEKWTSDIYPSDHVVLPGRGSFLPPPYFDRLLEKVDPTLYSKVKKSRQEAHEEMTSAEWFDHVNRRAREGHVKKLVTDQTLIRGIE